MVLYVEDEPDTFRLVAARLHAAFALLWAKTDREACELVSHAAPNLHAVLMDIELQGSVLDGLKLTQLLRGTLAPKDTPDFAQRVKPVALPIIVMTGYTAGYTEARAVQAGATAFLTKPIDFARLGRMLGAPPVKRA